MSELGSAVDYVCAACGAKAAAAQPFRCEHAGSDDRDHLVARHLDPTRVRFADPSAANPFARYRELFGAWQLRGPAGDADFSTRLEALDAAVARVDGHGFRVTPFGRAEALSAALGFSAPGGVFIKDETSQVGGSHKARHLVGIELYLSALEADGTLSRADNDRRGLAIASCGNAALGAAVIACAAGRPLTVFIPPDADPKVVERLGSLGAHIELCERAPGQTGDPCYLRFQEARAAGAIPFCCQGSDNGLTIEGGETLAWELVTQLAETHVTLDRLLVQVGGGALASACLQGLQEAQRLGAIGALPRLHTVQTEAAFPLRRAYERLRARIFERLGEAVPSDAAAAERMRSPTARAIVDEELAYALAHRSEFMWAWESAPHSIAHGILDDETYDWHVLVAGMIHSGGWPITVGEALLHEANTMGKALTVIPVDPTGSSGLAGLLALRAADQAVPGSGIGGHERVAVLFTGSER